MLKLYMSEHSQPSRAVQWLLEILDVKYEVVDVLPGSPGVGGSKHEDFLKKNPNGQIPVIEEQDGFILYESNAILVYLCEKYSGSRFYPKNTEQRAVVN